MRDEESPLRTEVKCQSDERTEVTDVNRRETPLRFFFIIFLILTVAFYRSVESEKRQEVARWPYGKWMRGHRYRLVRVSACEDFAFDQICS